MATIGGFVPAHLSALQHRRSTWQSESDSKLAVRTGMHTNGVTVLSDKCDASVCVDSTLLMQALQRSFTCTARNEAPEQDSCRNIADPSML